MAVKKTTNKAALEKAKQAETRDNNKRKFWSIILFIIGILLIVFSFIGDVKADEKNMTDHIKTFLCGMFGVSVFFIGPVLIYISIMISINKRKSSVAAKLIQLCVIILLFSSAMEILSIKSIKEFKVGELFEKAVSDWGGGLMSFLFGYPLMMFGKPVAIVLIILIGFVMFMLSSNITLYEFLNIIVKPFKNIGSVIKEKNRQYREDSEYLRMLHQEGEKLDKEAQIQIKEEKKEKNLDIDIEKRLKFAAIEKAMNAVHNSSDMTTSQPEPEEKSKDLFEEINAYNSDVFGVPPKDEIDAVSEAIEDYKKENEELEEESKKNEQTLNFNNFSEPGASVPEVIKTQPYALPSVELLNKPVPAKSANDIETELEQNSTTLVETLKSFGVQTKIVGVCRGPSVTRYELQPAAGVKISKITGLIDDIALNLATAGVRIEAPIPNKPAVGIEVPNRTTDTVSIRSLIDSKTYNDNNSKLAAVIGMDISGEIIECDIAKMPHILIAGTTGSGKSVCVNSIIMSILFRSTPEDVRFFMIDPKSVEFMIYAGIPHLIAPVVTDSKKAAGTLNTAVKMMTDRYTIFSEKGVRDIFGYNSLCTGDPELEKMSQIVIFIDEFADLMMVAANDVENSVCRLAQMGRASGIHLVIATQRPSVDVITGIIKANISSRIALKVASQVDSRTIIDSAGADKLLGKGDMLYFPVGAPKPVRVQGCWVSEKEIEKTVSFIKNIHDTVYDESVIEEIEKNAELVGLKQSEKQKITGGNDDLDMSDDKLDEAIDAVIEAGQASTSYLQRKLKLGYGRAARLIDIMEQMGVVGTFEGSKPRQVIMTKQEWYELKMNKDN